MISKLRKKIFIVLMSVMCIFLVLFLLIISAGIHNSNLRRSRRSMMQPPTGAEPKPQDEVFSPIACAVVADDGTVSIVKNQIYYLSEEDILKAVEQLQQSGSDHGDVTDYRLRYFRTVSDGKTNYFFADTTFERELQRSQTRIMGLSALGAVLLFFLISFFLSKWMVRPTERSWERQRRFIADASHELKTPLTVILSNTDLLMASGAISDAKNLSRIENISTESQRMKQLVEELLTLARTDTLPKQQKKEKIDFSYLVSSVILMLEPAIYDAGHIIQSDIQPDLSVSGISSDLQKLVEILVDNAGKYGTPGSDISISLHSQKRHALLSVTSEGRALTKEECVSIFERFYRADESRGEQPGYGLGLSIAQNIVKEHKGTIEAQSDGNGLNTFLVQLPLTL